MGGFAINSKDDRFPAAIEQERSEALGMLRKAQGWVVVPIEVEEGGEVSLGVSAVLAMVVRAVTGILEIA